MSKRRFRAFCSQLPGHCGAASLALCANTLGHDGVSQRDVAHLAHRPLRIFWSGLDEVDLRRAARALKLEREEITSHSERGRLFIRQLQKKLTEGWRAVLLVNNYGPYAHWVALVGMTREGSFKVKDSLNKGWSYWSAEQLISNTWHEDEEDKQGLRYALLVRTPSSPKVK